ncbi:hypothetical protein C7N43_08530 [Sphingobacteriales bacterium UPWRP_1]|nr:hypothetical protein B6N25_09380 [Sphingobacteriales bacterium TSM_CSS]PSJ77493.1 hypothetical protein C7N43_08530 [Sphingobacteriales bacterium UPWRP_1]
MKIKITLLTLLFLTWAFYDSSEFISGSSSTPPANMTGAPGTTNACTSCHSPGTGGSGAVVVSFNGGVNQYIAGQTYSMSVTVSQTGQKRWGFSMVARNSANQNVGIWVPTNTDSKVYSSSTHIGHKNAPNNVPDTYTFNFSWIAPATAGTGNVTFYAVGNAANGNNNSTGDYIYYHTLAITEVVPQPTAQLRVLLQGAMETDTTMKTYLNTGGFLPQQQPFNTPPWNYSGTEEVQNFPDNATDWVLLEARNATNDTIIVSRKAALLLSNGLLQDVGGSAGVTFTGIAAGAYYIAVKHRNHLPIITQTPITLPIGSDTPFNLTDAANVRYGNSQLIALSNNWGVMPCGDFDHNGIISYADYNQWKSAISILPAYKPEDANFDGQVNLSDFATFRTNIGRLVPQLLR